MTNRREFIGRLFAGATLAAASEAGVAPFAMPGRGRAPDDAAFWRAVRQQFLVDPGIAYMNTGSRGPSPRSVVAAQVEAIRAYDTDRFSYVTEVATVEALEALRARLAAFLGCHARELAITANTTEGMCIGTAGLDLQPGDEIVCTNHDHPSGAQPIRLRAARDGIRPVVADLRHRRFHPPRDPQALIDAVDAVITPRTRLISFCHINYTDGCLMPVREICALARAKGILTLVDGAHPPGMLAMNLRELGCDMYAGACHKWLLASMLTGFFYVREEQLERVWPLYYAGPVRGLNMHGVPYPPGATLDRSRTAAKYEMHGSGHLATRASLAAALDFHETLTPQAVEARVRHMAARVRDGLRAVAGVRVFSSDDPALSAGMVAFAVDGVEPAQLNELLWDRHRIYVRDVTHPATGWSANRASLHIMLDDEEVGRLIGAVAEIAREGTA